jgi:GGDEF domain-containing protein
MFTSASGHRRARPVADAPALDGSELARSWLVALVAAAPLDRAAGLPGPRFAEDAPRLCAAIAAALSSDGAWRDLEPGGAAAPLAAQAAAMAGARDPRDAVGALDALRSAVWTAVVEALHRPPPTLVADLADRLGAVMATVAAAAATGRQPDARSGDGAAVAADARGTSAPEIGLRPSAARWRRPPGERSGPIDVRAVPPPGGAAARGSAPPRAEAADRAAGGVRVEDLGSRESPPIEEPASRPSAREHAVRSGPAGPAAGSGTASGPGPASEAAVGEGARTGPEPRARSETAVGGGAPTGSEPGSGARPDAAVEDVARSGPKPGVRAGTAVGQGALLARVEATLRDAVDAAEPLREAVERLRRLARDVDIGIEPRPDATDPAGTAPAPAAAEPLVGVPGGAAPVADGAAAPGAPAGATRPPVVADVGLAPEALRVRRLGDGGGAAGREPPATPWRAAIRRRLERHGEDGRPFAVLAVEIDDVERLLAAGDDGIAATVEAAEAAVLERLRPADTLIPERTGRYWLIAADTDPADAVALARGIAEAVGAVAPCGGAPLRATVGVSSCPADAQAAERLEALAEEALSAARATGLRVSATGG